MTLYMDVHRDLGATPEEIEKAHLSDLEAQGKHGVKYLKYWVNPDSKTVCCLVEGPSKEACVAVHKEAHGLEPDQIIEVESNLVEAFLGGQTESPIGTALWNHGGLDPGYRIILFTDLAGSTELTQDLGDEAAMGVLRVHDTIVRREIAARRGREVKHTGDGIMASFVSPSAAIEASMAIQRALAAHNQHDAAHPVKVRIGISAGEPVEENHDFFGAAVQLARRACDHADPERILVPSVVRDLCIGKAFKFVDLGDVPLKGFPEPVRLFDVAWS
ncbi:MAG: nickel-binding protein [Gemmatimonadota bacterium]